LAPFPPASASFVLSICSNPNTYSTIQVSHRLICRTEPRTQDRQSLFVDHGRDVLGRFQVGAVVTAVQSHLPCMRHDLHHGVETALEVRRAAVAAQHRRGVGNRWFSLRGDMASPFPGPLGVSHTVRNSVLLIVQRAMSSNLGADRQRR
jgi:hypothetical protein